MTSIQNFRGSSTAAAALALGMLAIPPTVSQANSSALVRVPPRVATTLPVDEKKNSATASRATVFEVFESLNPVYDESSERQTSPAEMTVGQLRSWKGLLADWDGEGGLAPDARSIDSATQFVRLLADDIAAAEPMLHANGLAGLYWNTGALYADLEFLVDGRITYFVQQNEDKHKGVLRFDERVVPPVLSALLAAETST